MYNGKGIPVPGGMHVFSNHICFSSQFSPKTLIFGTTKLKICMKDIILCEFKPKNFGQGLVITTNLNNKEGGVYQFNNLGDDGKLANFLI